MIKETAKYVEYNFQKAKEKHPYLNEKILKSALAYQYLHYFYFERKITINKILELNDNELGLLGPGNGCLTWFLEKTFGWSNILTSHSILHDAFGRFYDHHELGRGYTYCIPIKHNQSD